MSNPMFLNSAAMHGIGKDKSKIHLVKSQPPLNLFLYQNLQSLSLHGILHRQFNITYTDSSISHTQTVQYHIHRQFNITYTDQWKI